MHEDTPPLKVWAYSVSLVLGILFLFLSFTYSGYGPYADVVKRSNKNLEDALIEIYKDTSAISVVILGSSLTEDAIVNPRAIEEAIFKQTNRKANVLRVAIYYMNMDLAKSIDFFEYISKYSPQYLFIENFAMNLDEGSASTKVPAQLETSLIYFRNGFRKKMGLNTHDDFYVKWYTFDTNPTPDFYVDEFDSLTYKRLLREKMVVRQISDNVIANKAYEVLQEKGTKVVFLDMPQTDKLQKNLLDKSEADELGKLLEHYKQHYSVEYWPFTGNVCDSCFIDGMHLNYKGTGTYQEWFVSEFTSRR